MSEDIGIIPDDTINDLNNEEINNGIEKLEIVEENNNNIELLKVDDDETEKISNIIILPSLSYYNNTLKNHIVDKNYNIVEIDLTTSNQVEIHAKLELCNYIIIDLYELSLHYNTNILDNLINILKNYNYKLNIIGISNISTWCNTPLPWNENNYNIRKSSSNAISIQLYIAENKLLDLQNDNIRTNIINSGFLYGNGENYLKSLFLSAYHNDIIKCIETAELPFIHVADLVSITLNTLKLDDELLQKHRYIIATEFKNTKLQDIAKNLASSFSNGEIEILKRDKLPKTEIFWDFFSLFYEINPNSLWIHSKPVSPVEIAHDELIHTNHEITENGELNQTNIPPIEDKLEVTPDIVEEIDCFPTFEWQSVSICDSISNSTSKLEDSSILPDNHYYCDNSLLSQFIVANSLIPIRVLLYGPPSSGKSLASTILESKLGLPVININDLIKHALDKKDDFAAELEKSMVPNPDKKNKKKDKRIPTDKLIELVHSVLSKPNIRNKGFILDGFPRTSEESLKLFFHEDKPLTKYLPSVIVSLKLSQEQGLERIKAIPSTSVHQFHNDEEGFRRRFERFETSLDIGCESNPLSCLSEITTFSVDYGVDVDSFNVKLLPIIESLDKKIVKSENQSKSKLNELKQKFKKSFSKPIEESNISNSNESIHNVSKFVSSLLEVTPEEIELFSDKIDPFRDYCIKNIGEAITTGLVEVCRIRPDEPIDYLASFLKTYAIKNKIGRD